MAVAKRINVLVYSGTGVSTNSVQHTIFALRQLLQPYYAVLPIQTNTLLDEPWPATCAALVLPGGGDLGYCHALNGAGNRKIRSYVNNGGVYMGFCAGGYYGCSKCEFEVGTGDLEVVGDRELGFFPGICRGAAFKGFQYGTEIGTRASRLNVNRAAFATPGSIPDTLRSYFNGGGVFVDAASYRNKGVEILASYADAMDVDGGNGRAAVVHCKVGDGAAMLTGPHPEFTAQRLSKHSKDMDPSVVDAVAADEKPRADFLRACLRKLGLDVNQDEQEVLRLSRIHLSSRQPGLAKDILAAWQKDAKALDGQTHLEEDDTHFEVLDAAVAERDTTTEDSTQVAVHASATPSPAETPYFNHELYYSELASSEIPCRPGFTPVAFGNTLLYSDVVTSTSTLLEKNPRLTAALPQGTTLIAARQLAGRGRGANIWLSPPGSLLFSTRFAHPLALNKTAPLVFVQYLAGIAVAEAIRTYGAADEYAAFARCVRLKWPNDIYALHPSHVSDAVHDAAGTGADPDAFVKLGGVLVNSSYAGGDFTLVLGVGLNVANAQPTTSLNALLHAWNAVQAPAPNLPPFTQEVLLARVLSCFATIYAHFCASGFAGDIRDLYYRHWLHTGQEVTLEAEGGARARIVGVTGDWGLLLAEAVDGSGARFALQSDANSFDFLRGLVRRKV